MRGGAKSLAILACLAAGGCTAATQTADLKIRAIPDASAKLRPGSGLMADASAQLALGNVGLALEGFRKALRDDPNNPDAYAGIAKCYESMGRTDLARANYEAALALTPKSPQLLTAVAVSLDQQGEHAAAASAREEAATIVAQVPAATPAAEVHLSPALLNSTATVVLPPAAPVAAPNSSITVKLPPLHQLADNPVASTPESSQRAAALLKAIARVNLASNSSLAAPTSSVTVKLPELRAFANEQPRAAVIARAAQAVQSGPYLERLSLGEVALVTDGRPAWRAQVVAQNRVSTTVRWVPIMSAEARPNVRVLNAAQRQGLAAQARTLLMDRGWRRIEIGDASDLRQSSIVYYPASRRTLGRSLAAQFGFPAQQRESDGVLVVLLGRDARNAGAPRRG